MNLPSGESIVRQIVHGQRWFESHFGRRCTEVWIPDVFGYPAGLPQVFAAGGMRRFVTQKLSWNRTNRFPHSTFWWEGLDGTRVLTHFPPVDTYNAEITPAEMAYSVGRFAEHAWSDWSLMPFGYGDGGGGPTREMLERLRRLADLDGMPRVEHGHAGRVLRPRRGRGRRAARRCPVWRGELYFETHRGTLTSQLRTKVGNRRCERLLREAELWRRAAGRRPARARRAVARGADPAVPRHPPGLVDRLGARRRRGRPRARRRRAGGRASASARRRSRRPARRSPTPPTVDRDEVVVTDGVTPAGDGPVQRLPDGRVAFRAGVPGLGLAPAVAVDVDDRVVVTDRSMANGHLAVALGPRRQPALGHRRRRGPRAAAGRRSSGAVLELAADQPVRYDAWDLESWVRRDPERADAAPSASRSSSAGPLRRAWCACSVVRAVDGDADVRAARRVARASTSRSSSTGTTTSTCCRWRSRSTCGPTRRRAASSSAPCAGRPTPRRRGTRPSSRCAPTATSTSPSRASAWPCSNDGRYGHALFDGAVRVSLARAARYPDPDADQGRHEVTMACSRTARAWPSRRRGRAPRPAGRGVVAGGPARRRCRPGRRRSPAPASRSTPSSSPTTARGDLDRPPPRGVRRPGAGHRARRRAGSRRASRCNLLEEPTARLRGQRRHRRRSPCGRSSS